MSHFIVAVFTKENGLSVEELLAPYEQDKWDSWKLEESHLECLLKLKDSGNLVNSVKVKDIDFSFDEEAYQKALRNWEIIVEHKPLKDDEEKPFSLYGERYYREYYGDKETYAKRVASFKTYSVITPDGVWHESAPMWWFGISFETPEQAKDWDEDYARNFLATADPEWTITIINCHI